MFVVVAVVAVVVVVVVVRGCVLFVVGPFSHHLSWRSTSERIHTVLQSEGELALRTASRALWTICFVDMFAAIGHY